MEVIRSRVLGFCMGVRRAVDVAIAEAQSANGVPVYTLGSLIHNPNVLEDLKAKGVSQLTENELPRINHPCSVIIRAHGINPKIEKELCDRGIRVIDATCPKVKASQLKAEELSYIGYSLFLAGEADHAEIKGITGYAAGGSFCVVVGNVKEARKAASALYNTNANTKTALLGQTTITQEEYNNIENAIKMFFPNLEVEETICAATNERQQSLRDLLEKTEAVIIVGGEESANTRRLLTIAVESGKPSILAENAAGIPKEFFTYKTVGLCAGASTPDSVIDEIEKKLRG